MNLVRILWRLCIFSFFDNNKYQPQIGKVISLALHPKRRQTDRTYSIAISETKPTLRPVTDLSKHSAVLSWEYYLDILCPQETRLYEPVGAPQTLAATNQTFYAIRPKSVSHISFVEWKSTSIIWYPFGLITVEVFSISDWNFCSSIIACWFFFLNWCISSQARAVQCPERREKWKKGCNF